VEGFGVNAEKLSDRGHAQRNDAHGDPRKEAAEGRQISSLNGEAYSPFYW
jgi:hypothetical protein